MQVAGVKAAFRLRSCAVGLCSSYTRHSLLHCATILQLNLPLCDNTLCYFVLHLPSYTRHSLLHCATLSCWFCIIAVLLLRYTTHYAAKITINCCATFCAVRCTMYFQLFPSKITKYDQLKHHTLWTTYFCKRSSNFVDQKSVHLCWTFIFTNSLVFHICSLRNTEPFLESSQPYHFVTYESISINSLSSRNCHRQIILWQPTMLVEVQSMILNPKFWQDFRFCCKLQMRHFVRGFLARYFNSLMMRILLHIALLLQLFEALICKFDTTHAAPAFQHLHLSYI